MRSPRTPIGACPCGQKLLPQCARIARPIKTCSQGVCAPPSCAARISYELANQESAHSCLVRCPLRPPRGGAVQRLSLRPCGSDHQTGVLSPPFPLSTDSLGCQHGCHTTSVASGACLSVVRSWRSLQFSVMRPGRSKFAQTCSLQGVVRFRGADPRPSCGQMSHGFRDWPPVSQRCFSSGVARFSCSPSLRWRPTLLQRHRRLATTAQSRHPVEAGYQRVRELLTSSPLF